jgi:hypothetical protein
VPLPLLQQQPCRPCWACRASFSSEGTPELSLLLLLLLWLRWALRLLLLVLALRYCFLPPLLLLLLLQLLQHPLLQAVLVQHEHQQLQVRQQPQQQPQHCLVLLRGLKPFCCKACCAAVHAHALLPPLQIASEALQHLALLLLLLQELAEHLLCHFVSLPAAAAAALLAAQIDDLA